MDVTRNTVHRDDGTGISAALRSGADDAFRELVDGFRSELHVHCYRMLGSYDDAEDAVQDTFARAWRYRSSLREGRPIRPWLYRVATNASLDAIRRRGRAEAGSRGPADRPTTPQTPGEVSWLQPYPDRLLEPLVPREQEPDARLLRKETIELAFLTAIQLLTPQQRAALILRDVLGWSAAEAAELLEVSVAALNSSLQRARTALRERLPARHPDWPAGADPTAAEEELLQRYVRATEGEDAEALAALIREDATFRMPPDPSVAVGRDAVLRLWAEGGFGTGGLGELRCLLTRANLQPAVACYARRNADAGYRPLGIDVLSIEQGLITRIVAFPPDQFPRFALPGSL